MPSTVAKRLRKNVGKPRLLAQSVRSGKANSFCRRKITIVEALDVCRISLDVAAIEKYFLGLVVDNSPQQLQECPFCLFQRELSSCIYLRIPDSKRISCRMLIWQRPFATR